MRIGRPFLWFCNGGNQFIPFQSKFTNFNPISKHDSQLLIKLFCLEYRGLCEHKGMGL